MKRYILGVVAALAVGSVGYNILPPGRTTAAVTPIGVGSGAAGLTNVLFFGDASDGALAVTGPVTLEKNPNYSTISWPVGSTGTIESAGYVIRCRTLDLTNAPPGAIRWTPNNGLNAISTAARGTTAGEAYGSTAPYELVLGQPGANSGAGGNGAGAQASAITATPFYGGVGGTGGTGGTGAGGAGGASRGTTQQPVAPRALSQFYPLIYIAGPTVFAPYTGGASAGGSGGGGSGAAAGGGGGGSIGGGTSVRVQCAKVIRGATTGQCAIRANGGSGGNGFTAITATAGGGGGAGGAGGGHAELVYQSLAGSIATEAICADGGRGGDGGNGSTTGIGGWGGWGGSGGRVTLYDLGSGTLTTSLGSMGFAGEPGAGTTGGAGGTGGTNHVSF